MERVYRFDAWLLARYQAVADWAFTAFGTSPWYIAAQLSGFVAVCAIVYCSLGIAIRGVTPFGILAFLCNAGLSVIYYYDARRAHETWLKGRLPVTAHGWLPTRLFWLAVIFVFDILWMISTGINIYHGNIDYEVLRLIISTVFDFTCLSAVYFLACTAPTMRNWNFNLNPEPQVT